MKLVTISFSHYADKARWALEHFGVPYVEAAYLPLLHGPGVLWATRLKLGEKDAVSTRIPTPVLITDGGAVIYDSSAIARWVSNAYGTPETTLYPREHLEAIRSVENEVGERLGPHTRRWGYWVVMRDAKLQQTLVRANATRAQAALFGVARPLFNAALTRLLRIDADAADRSRKIVRELFDSYAPRVEGRSYLLGERLTAADISLATMAAPILGVGREDGYGARLPSLEEVGAEDRRTIEEMRDSAVGRFALRMYRQERARQPSAAVCPAARVLH